MHSRITKKEVREEPDRENRARLESLRQKQEMPTRATPATRAEQKAKAKTLNWNPQPIQLKKIEKKPSAAHRIANAHRSARTEDPRESEACRDWLHGNDSRTPTDIYNEMIS